MLGLDIARHRAIDIPATVAVVMGSRILASAATEFTGVDLALPARAFATTTITKMRSGQKESGLSYVGLPLAAALPVGSRAA